MVFVQHGWTVLRFFENCDLSLQRFSHRQVSIKFAKGSGNLRDPINVFAKPVVSVHAQRINRVGDGSVNLRRSFCGEACGIEGDQMAMKIRYKHRKRGIFGWFFLIAFWLFNALMLLWVVAGWFSISGALSTERLGVHIGAVIIPVYFWVVGDLILGLFAYLTRGRRFIIMGD